MCVHIYIYVYIREASARSAKFGPIYKHTHTHTHTETTEGGPMLYLLSIIVPPGAKDGSGKITTPGDPWVPVTVLFAKSISTFTPLQDLNFK